MQREISIEHYAPECDVLLADDAGNIQTNEGACLVVTPDDVIAQLEKIPDAVRWFELIRRGSDAVNRGDLFAARSILTEMEMQPRPNPYYKRVTVLIGKVVDTWSNATLSDTRKALAEIEAEALKRVRLMKYHDGRELKAAFHCRNLQDAYAVMAFLGRIHICARCSVPFVPKKSNQFFCSPRCESRQRMQRYRANLREKKQ